MTSADEKLGSSRVLTGQDAAIAKALINAGWMQSDVASLLQCNSGRISEINTGQRYADVAPASLHDADTVAVIQRIQTAWMLRIGALLDGTVGGRHG